MGERVKEACENLRDGRREKEERDGERELRCLRGVREGDGGRQRSAVRRDPVLHVRADTYIDISTYIPQ